MIKDLLALNVNEHTEKKNKLTYLSWAWAWAEALKADEKATYKVELFANSEGVLQPFMNINGTCMVWVTVILFGKSMTCQLPVMNHMNKAIQNPDAFAVNTAIMRCMTKSLSLHGLGLYIYAGDDLPEGEDSTTAVDESRLLDYIAAFDEIIDIDGLKKLYIEAYAACDGNADWQKKVIAKKDEIKGKLS